MSDGISSNVSALGALGVSLDVTAHNIANVSTEGYHPLRATLSEGSGGQGVQAEVSRLSGSSGVDVAGEMVNLMQTSTAFSANATMIRAAEETSGTVLNLIA